MDKETVDYAIEKFAAAVEYLGPPAEKLYGLAVRQMYAEALVSGALALSCIVVTYLAVRNAMRISEWSKKVDLVPLPEIGLAVVVLVSIPILVGAVQDLLYKALNPEWQAIRMMLRVWR